MLPALVLMLAAAPLPKTAALGTIDFPVTGPAACRKHFTQGMLSLHSFMYEDAHAAFQAAGPHCPMAAWGDAMAYAHPLWSEVELEPARAALAKAPDADPVTPKERAYLGAARALFGPGDTAAREQAWLAATEQMQRDFPTDDEVVLQHALALLAPSNNDHFRNVRRLMESAALSFAVLGRHPHHPGAAHYAIHACDSPDHAALALPAARLYAQIAPAASHALHMPSHIFVQLGMWPEVARSNEAAWGAISANAQAKHQPLAERDLHSFAWWVDAQAEMGRLKDAEALRQQLALWLQEEDGAEARFGYAQVAAALIRNGRWSDAEALLAPLDKPLPREKGEASTSLGCALHAPGAGGKVRPPLGPYAQALLPRILAEAALRRGDEQEMRKQDAAREVWLAALEPFKGAGVRKDIAERWRGEAEAFAAIAHARATRAPAAWAEALRALAKPVAAEEDSTPSGPAFVTPLRQLRAEVQLDSGHPKEALEDYERVLETRPMMARALLGAARAAKAAGEMARAQAHYVELSALWRQADPGLPDLAEVRQGASGATGAAGSP